MKLVVENEVLVSRGQGFTYSEIFEMAECPVQRDTEFRASNIKKSLVD